MQTAGDSDYCSAAQENCQTDTCNRQQNCSITEFYKVIKSSVTIMVEDCTLFHLKNVTAENRFPQNWKAWRYRKCMQMLYKWYICSWLPIWINYKQCRFQWSKDFNADNKTCNLSYHICKTYISNVSVHLHMLNSDIWCCHTDFLVMIHWFIKAQQLPPQTKLI